MNRANRRKVRSTARASGHDGEALALARIRSRELAAASVIVSDEAAQRALGGLSPAAARLVMGMVLHVGAAGGMTEATFEQALGRMGVRSLQWATLEELHAAGLLRVNHCGAHVLHPLLCQVAHHIAGSGRRSTTRRDAPADVLSFAPGAA